MKCFDTTIKAFFLFAHFIFIFCSYCAMFFLRNNPNVTNKQLSIIIGISETAIENNIRILRENKIIERKGSKKTGFWKIIE